MPKPRDLALFMGSVLGFAVALSAIAWLLPRVDYNPSDALGVIGVASVILSARGASWPRRLLYSGIVIAGFILVDASFLISGLMHYAFAGLAALNPGPSVLAITFVIFAQVFPLAVLVVFVGRDPSVLWIAREQPKKRVNGGGKRRR